MDIGRLDTWVEFEKPERTLDATSSPVTTWSPAGETWATWTPTAARDRLSAPQPLAQFGGTLTMRFLEVDGAWRVRFDGHAWRITGVSHYGRRESTMITVERIEVPE